MTNKKLFPRHIRRNFRFDTVEFEKIQIAAEAEHLPLAVWARQILLAEATKQLTKATVRHGVLSILRDSKKQQQLEKEIQL